MRWLRILKFVVGGGLLLLILLGIAGVLYERSARSSAIREYPPPGRLVSLGTHALHIDCRGTGSPTVVLESGMDPLGSLSWSLQHDRLASMTRTCAYDRAGIAWSEIGPRPRTGQRIADELAELLRRAGESGPIVLVAQSMGGPYARIFAGKHPGDIAGIVLVETSHPEQFDRLPMADNFSPPPRLFIRAVPLLRKVGIMRHVMTGELRYPALPADKQEALLAVSAGSIATVISEFGEIKQTLQQAQEVRTFGDVPLLVLSVGDPPDASKIANFEQEQADAEFVIWVELQRELAELSSRGRLQQIPDSTHYMQFSQPDAVVDAVQTVLEEIRVES